MADPTEDVTMAILSTKLDAIKEDTSEIKSNNKALEKRVRQNEADHVSNKVQHQFLMWGQGVFTLALTAVRAKIGPIIGLE